jgi:hypothetical protein
LSDEEERGGIKMEKRISVDAYALLRFLDVVGCAALFQAT